MPAGPPAPSASLSSSLPPSPQASPAALRDGCLAELDETAATAELVATIERNCVSGMVRLGLAERASRAGELAPPAEVVLDFELSGAGTCVRFVAAAPPHGGPVELVLVDPAGAPCDRGESYGRYALLGAEGGVCLPPGRYRAVARSGMSRSDLLLAGFVAR